MDINELMTKAEGLIGDNKELGSAFGEIKSAVGAIVEKKDELLGKNSELSKGVKELGGAFGIEAESSKDILAGITEARNGYESKIQTLSGSSDSLSTKVADLEQKLTDQNKTITDLNDRYTAESKQNQISTRTSEIRDHLAKQKITDPESQKLAIAAMKEEHTDLLKIEDVEKTVSKFAENNPRLVDSKLNSNVPASKLGKDQLDAMPLDKLTPQQRQERMKQKYSLAS